MNLYGTASPAGFSVRGRERFRRLWRRSTYEYPPGRSMLK